jgi:hypothetical protein
MAGWLIGCSGGGTPAGVSPSVPEGESSPETAVETFLFSAKEAFEARQAGEFTVADRAYQKMAAVFGTENGSISRSYPASEVRDRMIVLSACLRPVQFTLVSHSDPEAWQRKTTVVTVELVRDVGRSTMPFHLVVGRGDRWFVDRIDLTEFAC